MSTKAQSFNQVKNSTKSACYIHIVAALIMESDLSRNELALRCQLRVSSVCARVNELMLANKIKVTGTKYDKESNRQVETLALVGYEQ